MDEVVDLTAGSGQGPLWGTAAEDLNATLIAWGPGDGPGEQVNASRDVLYVVVAGSATFEIDASAHALRAPAAVLVAKGKRRKITAGDEGVRYVTAHLRRGGLEISRSGAAER